MKALLLFAIALLALGQPTFCQSAPPSFGPSLTISNGQYAEVIPADTLRRIGRHAYSTVTGRAYRFSFQGQANDGGINGNTGTSFAFEHRMYYPRVGRFLSIDPLAPKYPYWSPYVFSGNHVIDNVELEGLEPVDPPSFWNRHQDDRPGYYGNPRGNLMRVSDANSVKQYWVYRTINASGTISWQWFNEGKQEWENNWIPNSLVEAGEGGVPFAGDQSSERWWDEFRANVGMYQPWYTTCEYALKGTAVFSIFGIGGIASAGPATILTEGATTATVSEIAATLAPRAGQTTTTLYRALSGTEAGADAIFLTESESYAAAYAAEYGGTVTSFTVDQVGLRMLQFAGQAELRVGQYINGAQGSEIVMWGKEAVKYMLSIGQKVVP